MGVERDPVIAGVGNPQDAGRVDREPGGPAQRAGYAVRLARLARLRPVTDLGTGATVRVDVLAERPHEGALLVEHRDPIVGAVGDVHQALGVDGQADRGVELAPRRALLAGLADRRALLEARSAVAGHDVPAERAQEVAPRREDRDPVVLRHVHAADRVDRRRIGAEEQTRRVAPARTELAQRHDCRGGVRSGGRPEREREHDDADGHGRASLGGVNAGHCLPPEESSWT